MERPLSVSAGTIRDLADEAAGLMWKGGENLPVTTAVWQVLRGRRINGDERSSILREVLRELGRRGGIASASSKKAKKRKERRSSRELQKSMNEANRLARARRDHLLPDP